MATMQSYTQPERRYRCKFFIDENHFLELMRDKPIGEKTNHPYMEKDLSLCDIPTKGEVILLGNYHSDKPYLYQIETVYRHFHVIAGSMRDLGIEYRILLKKLEVLTRIVMVEKYKEPVKAVTQNGRIYHPIDLRNAMRDVVREYYYEADDDEMELGDAFEVVLDDNAPRVIAYGEVEHPITSYQRMYNNRGVEENPF